MNLNVIIFFSSWLLHGDALGALLKRSPSGLGNELEKIFGGPSTSGTEPEHSFDTSHVLNSHGAAGYQLAWTSLNINGDSFETDRGKVWASLHKTGPDNYKLRIRNTSEITGRKVFIRYKDAAGNPVYEEFILHSSGAKSRIITIPLAFSALEWYATAF